ncbi:MAG: hypothetical protein R2692_02345 [Microbacterium sp.]
MSGWPLKDAPRDPTDSILVSTIATFDYARGLPVFTEFFDDWMMPDSHLRRRRHFPSIDQ